MLWRQWTVSPFTLLQISACLFLPLSLFHCSLCLYTSHGSNKFPFQRLIPSRSKEIFFWNPIFFIFTSGFFSYLVNWFQNFRHFLFLDLFERFILESCVKIPNIFDEVVMQISRSAPLKHKFEVFSTSTIFDGESKSYVIFGRKTL